MFVIMHHNKHKCIHFKLITILINYRCLKKYLTPMSIEKPNIMEMCGRICSVLSLFIPVSNYSFENLLNSLNVIYEKTNINLGKYNISTKMYLVN